MLLTLNLTTRSFRRLVKSSNLIAFLLAGQSNMVGRAPFDGGSTLPEGTLMFNQGGNTVPATVPLDHLDDVAGEMGPEIGFAEAFKARYPNKTILFIPASQGGTGFVDNQWGVGDPLYVNAVNQTNAALAANPEAVLGGILWCQGGRDAGNANYEAQLDATLNGFRTDIVKANSRTPIMTGALADERAASAVNYQIVQDIIVDTPNRVLYSAFVPATGLPTLDGLHFTAAAYRTFGAAFFDAIDTAKANDYIAPPPPPPPAGSIPAQAEAAAHWVFGDDRTDMVDLVSGQTLTGTVASHSPGYMTLNSGNLNGLGTGILEAPDTGMAFVTRVPVTNGVSHFGGTITDSGIADDGHLLFGNTSRFRFNERGGGIGLKNLENVIANEWLFMAYMRNNDGSYFLYRGDQTTPKIVTGNVLPRAMSPREIGIGNLHNPNSTSIPVEMAEAMVFTSSVSVAAMSGIYNDAVARMADRGITVR